MTNVNGDMGWSTGTGDPMTTAYVGHVAALRMARALGDEEATKHYAYRAARVAVPAVSRFWYTTWARQQGLIPANHIVQGFWEKNTFTSTAASQNTTDPWGPTNPLSGNGAQHEFFSALMKYAPEGLRRHQDDMLAGYPNLFNPDHVYTINTTYGGNSVYVTFPNIYARIFLGEPTEALWELVNRCQSNRRTTGWVAPNVIAELLARDTPMILTEWAPLQWRRGEMSAPAVATLSFTARQPQSWTLQARLLNDAEVISVNVAGSDVPFTVQNGRLAVTATVQGDFDVIVRFDGATCQADIVVDNETTGAFTTTGPWTASANPPLVGTSSLFAFGAGQPNTATWRPTFDCGGRYEVYATWVASSNRTVSAPYTINHAEESTTVRVNQQTNGNRWNLLGEFRFGPGTAGNVVLTDEGVASADIVSADAVRFVLIQPDEEPTPGSTVGWLVQ